MLYYNQQNMKHPVWNEFRDIYESKLQFFPFNTAVY